MCSLLSFPVFLCVPLCSSVIIICCCCCLNFRYSTAENGTLSNAASLSVPDAGILSLRGKTWLASRIGLDEGGRSSRGGRRDEATFTPSTGGAGGSAMNDEIERAQEEARRERSRRRVDGKLELNLLASLLGRAVQETEGKASETGDGGGGEEQSGGGADYSGPAAFRMNLFAEDPFASALVGEDKEVGQKNGAMETVHVEGRSGRSRDVRDDVHGWGNDENAGESKRSSAGSKSAGGKTGEGGGGGSKTKGSDDDDSDDSDDDLLGLLDEADEYAANHK